MCEIFIMTTIILTSTVNVYENIDVTFQKDPESRLRTYLRSVLNWLNNTNFNIVLVENSGYNFDELREEKEKFKDRFEVIVFDETGLDDCIKHAVSKVTHELFAINYVFNHSKLIRSSNFIIKVTARFYIPGFEEFLNEYDLNQYDCLVQSDRGRCEVVGSHRRNFSAVFEMYTNAEIIAEFLWMERTSKYANILTCNTFQIDETPRGGASHSYNTI